MHLLYKKRGLAKVKIEKEISQGVFESPIQKAVVNIIYTNNHLQFKLRELFNRYDITSQQYNVLRILRGHYPNVVNPSYIKEVMLDKNPDLTRLCDRLTKQGYIERKISKENRRKMNLKITDKGLELLKKLDTPEKEFYGGFQNLSSEELMSLSDLLDKLRG